MLSDEIKKNIFFLNSIEFFFFSQPRLSHQPHKKEGEKKHKDLLKNQILKDEIENKLIL